MKPSWCPCSLDYFVRGDRFHFRHCERKMPATALVQAALMAAHLAGAHSLNSWTAGGTDFVSTSSAAQDNEVTVDPSGTGLRFDGHGGLSAGASATAV